MKLVLITYSCCPNSGSEPAIGWETAVELSRYYQVVAIAERGWKESIEAGRTELSKDHDLTVLYHQLPKNFRWAKRNQNLRYLVWLYTLRKQIRNYVPDIGNCILQHVTFVRYWMPCFPGLEAKHFLFGPVGGADCPPADMRWAMPLKDRLIESVRESVQKGFELLSPLKKTLQKADAVMGVTPQTKNRLEILGASNVHLIPAITITNKEIHQIQQRASVPLADPPVFLCAGRLMGIKCYNLAIRAFAEFCKSHPKGSLHIAGIGPHADNLKSLAMNLGIEARVIFRGLVPRESLLMELGQATALIHPSLRDSGGYSLIEAFAASTPVICLDAGGGPQLVVTDQCGIKVPTGSSQKVIAGLAEAMRKLVDDREFRDSLGNAGLERVKLEFLNNTKIQRIIQIYQDLNLDLSPARPPDER